MAYLYSSNLDPIAQFSQIEIQLDIGSSAILKKGERYDLSSSELARARIYVVMEPSDLPASEDPTGILRLPIKGNPADGQVPVWESNEGAFVPGAISGDGLVNIESLGASTGSSDNQSIIQAALNAGTPLLVPPKGADFITGPLTLPAGSIIQGLGFESRLKLKASSTGALISLSNVDADRVRIKELHLDGNRANQTSSDARGIYLYNRGMGGTGLPNHRLSQLIITECKGDGIKVDGPGESQFSHIYSYKNDGVGVYCLSEDSYWNVIVAAQSGSHGIWIAQSNTHWTNAKAWFNGRITGLSGHGWNITHDNQGIGFMLDTADYCRLSAFADSNGTAGSPGAVGLKLFNAHHNNITLTAYDRLPAQPPLQGTTRTQTYAIDFGGGSGNNRVDLSAGQHLTGIYSGAVAFNKLAYTNYDGNSYEILRSSVTIPGTFDHDGSSVGFYGTAPVAKQTGVAVTAAGVHAALVNLGLISA
jgi:hypothetical protein